MLKSSLVVILFCILIMPIYADMGAIVPVSDVSVSEPGQKAIIFYNGNEEILILGTDFETSDSVGILRFIPLPSKPKVDLAPKDCFDKLEALVKRNNMKYLEQYKGSEEIKESGAVELYFEKKLGAHDITVIKVHDSLYFRKWVNDYFKKRGLEQQDEYPEIESIVTDYVSRGIVYFVFDFVKLSEKNTSVDPIVYRFDSQRLYYPLKTSNIFGGAGQIDLFIFAKLAKRTFFWHHFLFSTTVNVTSKEIMDIYPKAADLFKEVPIVLQAAQYKGKLNFKDDISENYDYGVEELKPYYPRKP